MTEQPKPQEAWSRGTEVVSMYNFRGSSSEDLPFRRGEVMTIIRATRDPMWYFAHNQNGREGMIPSNYVQKRGEVKLHAMPWFHSKMSREEAVKKLTPIKQGLFLVRESNNFLGDYSLSVCGQDKIDHYHIVYHGNKLTIDEETFFENLTQLVEFCHYHYHDSWFHGKMTRQQAEGLLNQSPEDGIFLVRESVTYPGDYTLCVACQDKVEHYRIMYRHNKLTIDEEEFFENLTHLIQHYEKDADGLCTRLIKPVEKKGQLEYSVDQKKFEEQGWLIRPKDIKLGDFIGGGDFANVYKAIYVPNNTPVAVKTLKDENRAIQQFLAEASVMTSLQHENLVKLIGVVTGGQQIQIITEFMAKGNLVEYLRTRGRAIITNEDQINFASDTCRGMAYLESKHLVHRDLAARNVLINEEGKAKVSDFGLARPVDANQDGGRFPIKWTAPEALRESKFTNKSDMWSFGILLWEIYSFGRVPYPRIPLADVVSFIERGYRNEQPDGCPEEIYKIMEQAWNLDAKLRPTFDTVMHKLDRMRTTPV